MEPLKPIRPVRLRVQIRGFTVLLLVCALTAIARTAAASPQLNPAYPLNFFTNVASRLLSSQLNVKLDYIQIYPTNQYTPAVHRLLQVTANILDATTTNYYPSVFRPLFWKTNEEFNGVWHTNIYIVGYQYVQEPLTNGSPIFTTPTEVTDTRVPFGLSGITNNIYGIPWVIGVKKGLPNFNAFELDNCFFIERRLQFNRNNATPSSGTFPYGRVYTTNQMYIIGISNAFAIDDWNSYAEDYTNPVTIVAQDSLSVTLTNDAGVSIGNFFATNIALAAFQPWPSGAFAMPFGTNVTVMQNLSFPFVPPSANNLYLYFYNPIPVTFGGYTFRGPCFIPTSLDSSNYLDLGTPPLPQFGLAATNQLQAYMLDTDSGGNVHILDYVQFGDMNSSLNVNQAISDTDENGLWSTNYFTGSTTPVGVVNQFLTSMNGGTVPLEDRDGGGGGQWSTTPVPGAGTDTSPTAQQAYFSAFFSPIDEAYYPGADGGGYITNLEFSIPAAFTPMREIVQRFVFQANDPVVHYLSSDLNDFVDDTSNRVNITAVQTNILRTIGHLGDRYLPWGNETPFGGPSGNHMPTTFNGIPIDNNPYNLSYKDPQVWTSDDWNFPTNETLNASWLGQVHRGTPWQTIYLKSPNILAEATSVGGGLNIGIPTWQVWTGDLNPADAVSMAPTADWQIAGLLASLFNTNNEASLFSVNDPNPSDWQNLLNGMTALTNDVPDIIVSRAGPEFATLTISSNSSQASEIASAIESARTALPGQVFATPGNIFAVLQLSADSPFLNVDTAQMDYGISDEAYEAIPDQLLPLLRVDSIGSMTTANGNVIIQFTGDDNHDYAVQSSANLVNWTTISTNCPVNGLITVTNAATGNTQFYRTVLVY